LIIERIRLEPGWSSETARELARAVRAGDRALADILFRHAETSVPALPQEDQAFIVHGPRQINQACEPDIGGMAVDNSEPEIRARRLRELMAEDR